MENNIKGKKEVYDLLNKGKCLRKPEWDERAFIFQRPKDTLPVSFVEKVKSLTENSRRTLLVSAFEKDIKEICFEEYICLYDGEGNVRSYSLSGDDEEWEVV